LKNGDEYPSIQAYKTSWGLHCPGSTRAKLLNKLADLIEARTEEFAALEALDVGPYLETNVAPVVESDVKSDHLITGKTYTNAKYFDVGGAVKCIRYYAGWADKVQGKTIEVGNLSKLSDAFTDHAEDNRTEARLYAARAIWRGGAFESANYSRKKNPLSKDCV